jgi:hypothetical protein
LQVLSDDTSACAWSICTVSLLRMKSPHSTTNKNCNSENCRVGNSGN